MYPTQAQHTTIETSVKPLPFTTPDEITDRYQAEIADLAAQIEATVDCPIEIDGRWHYLPDLDGRRNGKQSYRAELREYPDGVTLPVITFRTFRHGGVTLTWQAREALCRASQGSEASPSSLDEQTEAWAKARQEYQARHAEAERQKAEGQKAAAELAKRVWESSPLVQNHPFARQAKAFFGLSVEHQLYN